MAGLYADKTGIDVSTAASWMDGETWFNGVEAVDNGLADDFLPADLVSEDKDGQETKAFHALRRMDAALAKAGMPRSERRSLLNEFKDGTQDAAVQPNTQDAVGSGTQDAADVTNGLNRLIQSLKI